MKFVSSIILVVFLAGCASLATVSPDNIKVREGVLSSESAAKVKIGAVTSSVKSIEPPVIEAALYSSLKGQNLLADSSADAKYILAADYIKHSSPSWGTKTKVSVDIEYTLSNSKTGQVVFSSANTESCVSSTSLGETLSAISLPSAQETIAATASILTFGYSPTSKSSLDVKSRTALPGSAEDFAMGFPPESAPVSSNDAYLRSVYARECAIRKSVLKIMTDIIQHHQRST